MKKKLIIIFSMIASVLVIGLLLWGGVCVGYTDKPHTEKDSTVETAPPAVVHIQNMDDWIEFGNHVNNGTTYSGCEIHLLTDLDFEELPFQIIGTEKHPFEGSFFGNDHVLRNVQIDSSRTDVGVFGYISGAHIQALHLENCDISSEKSYSVGGIAGRSMNSLIEGCTVSGRIQVKNSSTGGIVGCNYGSIESCRTTGTVTGPSPIGGITGENHARINGCTNEAAVSDVTEKPYIAGGTAAGIAARNLGTITGCINFGSIYGGGIALTNKGTITDSYNFGDVYAGISVSAYDYAVIMRCVNFGKASGRHAADILSFAGEEDNMLQYIEVRQCLYTNTSKAGAIREKRGEILAQDNQRIVSPRQQQLEQLLPLLEEQQYEEAYTYLLQADTANRTRLTSGAWLCFSLAIAAALLIFLFLKTRVYLRAKHQMQNGNHMCAYRTFGTILWFWNSRALAQKCFRSHLEQCARNGTYEIGRSGEQPISWIKIGQSDQGIILMSEYALCTHRVHSSSSPVTWKNTELYRELNTTLKEQWFDPVEIRNMSAGISIPEINMIERLLPEAASIKCRPIIPMEGVLSDGEYVFWWILDDPQQPLSQMPMVTPTGTVSSLGKSPAACSIAVRPIIEVRM